ncbi:helicase SRCAP/SWR1, partial [Lecanoromycetidae sp. Uapishka_2]
MQGEALENGEVSNHVDDQQLNTIYDAPQLDKAEAEIEVEAEVENAYPVNGQVPHDDGHQQSEDNSNDAHPNKKRKLTDSTTRTPTGPRPISPPWKKIAVEGPTSFVEGGRRKSSRTNFVPIELQPQAEKRRTRGAIQQTPPVTKSKYGGAYKASPLTAPAATQIQNHGKPPQSAGKPAVNAIAKSPSKPTQNLVPPPQTTEDIPAPPKRSHKKKIRPISPQPTQSPQVPNPSNPHSTRRAARASENRATPHRGGDRMANGWHAGENDGTGEDVEELATVDPNQRPQRLSLKVRMPTVNVQHPGHVLPPRKYDSFQEWFNQEGRLGLIVEDPDPHLTEKDAVREARLRIRISQAAKPGGVLSEERCQYYKPEPFEPPPRLYTHQDRLVRHAVYFQKLMEQERNKHRRNAKEYAEKAAALVRSRQEEKHRAWRQAQPKTEEDIAREQEEAAKEIYEQIQEDLKQKWLMVTQLVEGHRMQRWQEEQDRLGKVALNEAIEKSKGLLDRRRTFGGSTVGSEDESDHRDASGSETPGSGSESESEDEGNMSSSQSETDEEQVVGDDDEGLTQEELRHKYASVADVNRDERQEMEPMESIGPREPSTMNVEIDGIQSSMPTSPCAQGDHQQNIPPLTNGHDKQPTPSIPLDDVDDVLMDDSDASTDMDSEESEDGQPSPDDGSEEEESDDEEPSNLLGFFGKKAFQASKEAAVEDEDQVAEGEDDEYQDETEEVSLIPDATQGPTPSATPKTTSEEPHTNTHKDCSVKTLDQTSMEIDHQKVPSSNDDLTIDSLHEHQGSPVIDLKSLVQDASLPTTPVSTNPLKTPVPSLLRGTLREYQHFGLDWLAGLYAAGTNGILADEMGLGKTIQTIALLAHLAVEHQAWGPHLIVVPTSVMLNWEIEFKKFLPGFKVLAYYGTQEERKKKRQGWMDDDKWNVWITSYTLVTNDQQIFKRKAWHYMILDEAHNIKNFQSLRWQTLLTFNTRARLLLTGTPLQNNLTELWSLLFFLMPSDSTETGVGGFADLQEFTDWFRKPVEQILEHGREVMDDDARAIVAKLHKVLRPYLLRRLKADVEKQMPGKYEHVLYCRLSKRQRYLYDGFMSRAQTRETLASGNTFSIMNALMQLRKVCNHPDLFETRQIVTSFAMTRSAVANFEINELLVRRRLLQEDPINTVDLNLINLLPGANEPMSALDTIQRQRLGALGALRQLTSQQWGRISHDLPFDGSSVKGALASYENTARLSRFEDLRHSSYLTSLRSQRRPLYSHNLMEQVRFGVKSLPDKPFPARRAQRFEWYSNVSPAMHEMVMTLPERAEAMEITIAKFACVTPAVVATDMAPLTLCPRGIEVVQTVNHLTPSEDPYHEARMRLSIAFPDKRLLQYDCGKLQRLDALLRQLQAGGHRALIFTQMTRVLDILEQFLNIHGHRYLRLDGATKIEQRQVLTDRFNNDNRILAFILSSRSGGIGINLTGADTVIFYDLDWNPAMDKQCQDRAHRIGQTRDVHIYRLVSEYTIEANILRKANQKRMLDDVVIQEGEFTTDYFTNMSVQDMVGDEAFDDGDAEVNVAMDRVLGGRGSGRVFEAVEDQEDIVAAKAAERELAQNQDAADFDEKGATSTGAATPKTPGPPTPGEMMPPPKRSNGDVERTTTMEAAESGLAAPGSNLPTGHEDIEELPSCDDYMMRLIEWELKDVPVQPPVDKTKKKTKAIAVIGAIQQAAICIERLRAIRQAPEELRLLCEEVADLSELLKQVQSAQRPPAYQEKVGAPPISPTGLDHQLSRTTTKLQELDRLVTDHASRTDRRKIDRGHFGWLRGRQKAYALREDLKLLRLNLAASLGATTSCTVERVETAIDRVHDEQAKTSQLLAALVNGLALQQPSFKPPPFGHLLERGARYAEANGFGQTILHIAARLAETRTLDVLKLHGLRGIDANAKDNDGKNARDYLEEREDAGETDREFQKSFEELLQYIERSNRAAAVVDMDGATQKAKQAACLAALDLSKDVTVTCYTPLASDDEDDEFDDVLEEIYPSHGALVFFDALEEVHEAPQAIEIMI